MSKKYSKTSVKHRLNVLIAVFILILVLLVGAFWFGMEAISSTRAFTHGEGAWAKIQKDAVINLLRYVETLEDDHHEAFHDLLPILLAGKEGRIEMGKEDFDYNTVKEDFMRVGVHPGDVPMMVFMFRAFGKAGPMQSAMDRWEDTDAPITQIIEKEAEIHEILGSAEKKTDLNEQQIFQIGEAVSDIHTLNLEITEILNEYSVAMGEASRVIKNIVLAGMLVLVIVLGLLFWVFALHVKHLMVEVDRVKSDFVFLASHQLKTPSTSINWYAERLTRTAGDLSDESKKYLEKIYKNSKRMGDLVRDLLSVARMDMEDLSITSKDVDVVKITREILKDFDKNENTETPSIKTEFESGSIKLHADKNLLKIIISNLVSNAVYYTGKEGEVKIKIEEIKKSNGILLSVSDTGMGISEEDRERIFDKFFRSENAKKENTTGSGLGLYLVKSIVDRVGGNVWFESRVGKGTTFYVELPKAGWGR